VGSCDPFGHLAASARPCPVIAVTELATLGGYVPVQTGWTDNAATQLGL